MSAADWFTILALVGASYFFLAGTIGVLRFPTALSRLHAVTKADNLGLGFVVLALLPQAASISVAMKLILIWVLALVASATSSYLIASTTIDAEGQERDT
jgi:multicomponent Na+:H+ antiporter subunit G